MNPHTNFNIAEVKIITVSGAHSGVGKTALIERLLKDLKGWSALKVTVSHNGSCPKGKPCGACDGLESKFSIVTDKVSIEEKGKDTQRFKAAGALKVFWLKARPDGLRQGLNEILYRLKNAKGVIIEGTSILKYIRPDLAILVKNKDSVLKPSAVKALKKIDLIWTNS